MSQMVGVVWDRRCRTLSVSVSRERAVCRCHFSHTLSYFSCKYVESSICFKYYSKYSQFLPVVFLCVCVCVHSSQQANLCVLNMAVGKTVSMSLCSFHAGRCHGDPLMYVDEGTCEDVDPVKLNWAKFRGDMAAKSSVQVPCDLNTCYEWETCSGEWRIRRINVGHLRSFISLCLFYITFL